MKFYFSHGRTALKYGLKYLDFKKNDKLMMPNYLCDVLLDPLKDLGIEPTYYEINDDFTVNFKSLKKNFDNKIKGIMFINFFGFEENKIKYYEFCKKKNLFIIEDNCHLLKKNFSLNSKIADLAFYSSRKFIKKSYSGGILEILNKKKNLNFLIKKLNKYPVSLLSVLNTFLENNFFFIKRIIKFNFFKMPNYNKINGINIDKINEDFRIDDKSYLELKKFDFDKLYLKRSNNYKTWKKFCTLNSIQIINRKIQKKTIPWLLPAYITDKNLKKKLFRYGWKEGFNIISWPNLPKSLINKKTAKKWNNLICFNTDKAPVSLKTLKF